MLLPSLLGFLLFVALPVLASLALSFMEWNLIKPPVFVGLGNYVELFTRDNGFRKVAWNTAYFMLTIVPLQLIFGLLLALTRQIHTAIRLGSGAWEQREAMRTVEIELEGLTMGIFGFGGTGRAMARRATGFGMKLLALDELAVPGGDGVEQVWPASRLMELLGASDVVAICCPLTDATNRVFNDAAFAAMKRGAILVNVTRGEVVDGEALVRALASGHLGGAALDVIDGEPLPADHPIWAFTNVAMTPHTAGASQYRASRNISRFVDNLVR